MSIYPTLREAVQHLARSSLWRAELVICEAPCNAHAHAYACIRIRICVCGGA